jgi:hypothetical protein
MTTFLTALCAYWNVCYAAELAGVGRATVYRWKHRDRRFAAAWEAVYCKPYRPPDQRKPEFRPSAAT